VRKPDHITGVASAANGRLDQETLTEIDAVLQNRSLASVVGE
jgi:hypothetical protein